MSELPGAPEQVGTVTVLFADMEGSASLLERVGEERFSAMLAVYGTLLRDRVAESGGTEEGAVGDGHMLPGAVVRRRARRAAAACRSS